MPLTIQIYTENLDFEITRLARFDVVLGICWHVARKPYIAWDTHV